MSSFRYSYSYILQHYIKFCLQDNSFILTTGSLFPTIREQAQGKPDSAIKEFFKSSALVSILFKEIPMWEGRHFPNEWKIHLDNNKDNIFGTIFLNNFLESSINIRFGNIDDTQRNEMMMRASDKQIILENLFFDKIDPQVFSYFFRMIYMPIEFRPNTMKWFIMEFRPNAMKWLIEEYVYDFYNGYSYILYPTTITLDEIPPSLEESEQQKRKDKNNREQNTFKFFWLYFRNYDVLQPQNVKKYISALRETSYNKENQKREFYRREYLITIFEQWLVYYRKQSDNQPTTTPTTSIPEA